MFPDNTLQEEINAYKDSLETDNSKLGVTPSFDYETSQMVLTNGTPKLITDIEAIQQWIIKFVITPRDVYPIYAGTNFGTSYRKLFGRKVLNNGYEESELEREITEGLPLCPAIDNVTNVSIKKNGRYLSLDIQVELVNGELVDTRIEKAYVVR